MAITQPVREESLAYFGGERHRAAKVQPRFTASKKTRGRIDSLINGGILSDWYGGPHVREFEEEFAAYHSVPVAVATNSGTSAIHAALRAAGVRAGDEVIAPTYCYFSAVSAVLQDGAVPVLYDSESYSVAGDLAQIPGLVTTRTRAVIVVHMYGVPSDLSALSKWLGARGILLIEDCGQAHGAKSEGRLVGTMGDFGCFSFASPRHHIAAGEGGMVIGRSGDYAETLRQIVNYGKNNDWRGPVRQGYSYSMPEFTAIVGRQGLELLEDSIERRRVAAQIFDEVLGDTDLRLHDAAEPFGETDRSAWYRKLVRIPAAYAHLRDWMVAAIEAENVSAKPPHPLLHQIPWMADQIEALRTVRDGGVRAGDGRCAYPNSEEDYAVLIDLETGPDVGEQDARLAAEAVAKVWSFVLCNPNRASEAAVQYGPYRF